jgi:F-type H+-transporting ATPase subunit c
MSQIFNFMAVAATVQEVANDPISSIIVASIFAIAVVTMAGIFPSVMQGLSTARAVEATGRQPEAAGAIRTNLLIGCVITETVGVYGLLVALLLIFVNPFVDMYLDAIARAARI